MLFEMDSAIVKKYNVYNHYKIRLYIIRNLGDTKLTCLKFSVIEIPVIVNCKRDEKFSRRRSKKWNNEM